ncbi:hypothetical protein GCM10010389_51330 [Streptomyces echinoruber]|uniref:Uncharacterized protein n=1 Tax=Streptomyces echinoruber TaxID=68898 RepID=A0A918VKS6_9ACTN|nr:hypothetical protein GCM10010389_51330 [Streptomyces echinoruber]
MGRTVGRTVPAAARRGASVRPPGASAGCRSASAGPWGGASSACADRRDGAEDAADGEDGEDTDAGGDTGGGAGGRDGLGSPDGRIRGPVPGPGSALSARVGSAVAT